MRPRPGHHAPLGSTYRTRMQWTPAEREPQLGDIVFEVPPPPSDDGADLLQRGYLVVGVEEPARDGGRWGLVLERLSYVDAVAQSLDRPWWCFYRQR